MYTSIVLRLPQAAQRDLLDERINYFLGNSLHHIGQGTTGKDVEEILSDDPRKTEAILATYMLFLNNGNGDVGMPS